MVKLKPKAEVAEWQTRDSQKVVRVIPREGSTPFLGTRIKLSEILPTDSAARSVAENGNTGSPRKARLAKRRFEIPCNFKYLLCPIKNYQHKFMNNKFFLYARKSTDVEDKQVLSIETQIAELRAFAKQNNLNVIDTFIEKQSAKILRDYAPNLA